MADVGRIRRLTSAEWWLLRDIRLRALSDSPDAFTACHWCERQWGSHQWRRRFDMAQWLVTEDGGAPIAMAGLVGGHPREPEHLESIWVAPSHRKQGVFHSLLDDLVEIARQAGRMELPLWVLEDNLVARLAYQRLGFVLTGERQQVQRRNCFELRMRLSLSRPSVAV